MHREIVYRHMTRHHQCLGDLRLVIWQMTPLMSENTNYYAYYTIASMIFLSPMTTSLMPDFLFLLKQKLII